MVGAQWRNGCMVCRCTRTGVVQCNKFCEFQLVSNGCPANTTLQTPDEGCCFCAPETSDLDTGTADFCEDGQFRCPSNGRCLSRERLCDGVQQCEDGADESYCNECLVTDWSGWGSCSSTCGIGARSRTRAIRLENRAIEACAEKAFKDIQHCQAQACAVDGYFSPWEKWSSCDRPCNGGLRQRTRACYPPKNGGKPCSGPSVMIDPCNLSPCVPLEGCFGDKNLLTASCEDVCPATCAEISAEVDCIQKCSNSAELVTGCFCKGNLLLQDGICVPKSKCNCFHNGRPYSPGTHVIEECTCHCENGEMNCEEGCEDGNAWNKCDWGSWSSWSICFTNDNSCDQTGVRHRFRTPQGKGKSCAGESSESEKCFNHCSPIWGEWSAECQDEVSACPNVVPLRKRLCPGHSCSQIDAENAIEVNDCCSVTCGSDMLSCDKCKVATCAAAQILDSSCIVHYNSSKLMAPEVNNEGMQGCVHQCSCPYGLFRNEDECVPMDQCYCLLPDLSKIETGSSFEDGCLLCTCTGASFHCEKKENCVDDGIWSMWSAWSTCSSSCVSEKTYPQQSRYRSCRAKNAQALEFFAPWLKKHHSDSFACSGRGIETAPCGEMPVCKSVFSWSDWSSWSNCEFCVQRRVRGCLFNGKKTEPQNCVDGKTEESKTCPCTAKDCPIDAFFVGVSINDSSALSLENAYCNGGDGQPTTEFCVCTDGKKIDHFGNCVEESLCSCTSETSGIISGGENFKANIAGQCSRTCKCAGGEVLCSVGDCAECLYGEWSAWSKCSTSCGVGSRVRFQTLMFQSSANCQSSNHEIEDCSIESCYETVESAWTEWGSCSRTCGTGAVKNRYLHDKHGETQNIETEFCTAPEILPCSATDSGDDDMWQWSAWSDCSKTCGGYGVSFRMKHCSGLNCSSAIWKELSEERLCGSVAPCHDSPESCPNGTLWNECGRACMETCARAETCEQQLTKCKHGCFCLDESQIYDHVTKSCVPVSSCHCSSRATGATLSPGETEKRDCNVCRCNGGRMTCTKHDCSKKKEPDNWCGWSSWSTCSRTCGSGWPQIRSRINKCGCGIKDSEEGCADFTDQFGSELVKVEHQDCHVFPNCPADGNWGSWSAWSKCDCRTFSRYKKRECNDPAPVLGGKICEGDALISESCSLDECNGQCPSETSFVECAACEKTCADISAGVSHCNSSECKSGCSCPAGLLMSRTGKCVARAACECSASIDGQYKIIQMGKSVMDRCNRCICRAGKLSCTKKKCAVDGYWSGWSEWSACRAQNTMSEAQCQLGNQWRSRICVAAENNGAACQGVKTQQRQCRTQCNAEWSSWSRCSNECGVGFKTRVKAVPECTALGNCPKERRPCHGELTSCPVHWSEWSAWTKCIGGCGAAGHQLRSRQCSGKDCASRNIVDSRECSVKCAGSVSEWTSWSPCSRECDLGVRSRMRSCSTEFCHEDLKEKEACFERPCYGPEGRNTSSGDTISPDSCPKDMLFSPCVSLCAKRSCATEAAPATLCNECIPGCVCPEGYLESSTGACVQESSCECKDSSGREWQSGARWTVRSDTVCESCSCETAGVVNCKKTSCAEFDDCTYTDWSEWSSCNSTCVAEESRRFRYREPLSGVYCSQTTELADCLESTPRCSDRCKGVTDGVSFKSDECNECSCSGGAELCVDLCSPSWSNWSAWSECPICGKDVLKARKRSCSGRLCDQQTEEELAACDVPECEANGDCAVTTQVRNFTREGCTAQNVVLSFCAGRCSSQSVIMAEYPYVKNICECCSYNLDPLEPVKTINMICPGKPKKEQLLKLPNIRSCTCLSCNSDTSP